jgi:hypothetical protein
MRVVYGPPGLKGVTTLVAVGADESDTGTDRVLKVGALGAVAIAGYGAYTKQENVRNVALGAAAALGLALFATGAFGRKVTITEPAPTTTPTGVWWAR